MLSEAIFRFLKASTKRIYAPTGRLPPVTCHGYEIGRTEDGAWTPFIVSPIIWPTEAEARAHGERALRAANKVLERVKAKAYQQDARFLAAHGHDDGDNYAS